MKKYIAATFLLGLSFLVSCGNNSQNQSTTQDQTSGGNGQASVGSSTTQNQQGNWGTNTRTKAS